jgi:hypothetical protein
MIIIKAIHIKKITIKNITINILIIAKINSIIQFTFVMF